MEERLQVIQERLRRFVVGHPENNLPACGGLPIYEGPLVGVAAADDLLFEQLKDPEVVGPEHLGARQLLPGARAVVSYFLPFTSQVRQSNRGPGLPSEEWVHARIDGEAFNDTVRRYLVSLLQEMGGQAVAPVLDEKFTVAQVKSNWSERHIAYIAGLGTFGLSKSLITSRGCAGRYGSVVTTLDLPPTPRPYRRRDEYCPWLNGAGCGQCIARCPSGAITAEGKDKWICKNYIDNVIKPKFAPRYGCAKCQVGVPCEERIPV